MNKNIIFDIAIILFFVIQAPQLLESADYDDPNNNDIFNEDAYFNYEEYVYGKSNFDEISKKALGEMNLRWERYILNADNDFFNSGKNENKVNNKALKNAVHNNKKGNNAGYSNKEDRNNIDNHLKDREDNSNNQKKSGRSNKSGNSNNDNKANRIVSANARSSGIVQKLQSDKSNINSKITRKESEKKSISNFISNKSREVNIEEDILTELLIRKRQLQMKQDKLIIMKGKITLKIRQLSSQLEELEKQLSSLKLKLNTITANDDSQEEINVIQKQIIITEHKASRVKDELGVTADELVMVILELQETQRELAEVEKLISSSKTDINSLETKVSDAEGKENKVENDIVSEEQKREAVEKDIAKEKNAKSPEESAKDVGRGPVENSPEKSGDNPFSSSNKSIQVAVIPSNKKDPEEEDNPEGEEKSKSIWDIIGEFTNNVNRGITGLSEKLGRAIDNLFGEKNQRNNSIFGNGGPQSRQENNSVFGAGGPHGATLSSNPYLLNSSHIIPYQINAEGNPNSVEAGPVTPNETQATQQHNVQYYQDLLESSKSGTPINNVNDVLWMMDSKNSGKIYIDGRYNLSTYIEDEDHFLDGHYNKGYYDPAKENEYIKNLTDAQNTVVTNPGYLPSVKVYDKPLSDPTKVELASYEKISDYTIIKETIINADGTKKEVTQYLNVNKYIEGENPEVIKVPEGGSKQLTTHCNSGVFDIAEITGVDISKLVKPVRDKPEESWKGYTDANEMVAAMNLSVKDGALITVTPQVAQQLANRGVTVIAGKTNEFGSGHVATVAPRNDNEDYDAGFGPLIANVGTTNNTMYTKYAFNSDPDEVTFYVDLEQLFNN